MKYRCCQGLESPRERLKGPQSFSIVKVAIVLKTGSGSPFRMATEEQTAFSTSSAACSVKGIRKGVCSYYPLGTSTLSQPASSREVPFPDSRLIDSK